jgi:hypothetical protein
VQPVSLSSTGVQFQFQYTASIWASIKVNFWASSNPAVQVGFLALSTFFFIQTISKPTKTTAL